MKRWIQWINFPVVATNKADKGIDHVLLFLTLCLVAIGILMVYSSSSMLAYELYQEDSFRYLKVQLVASVLGFIGMMCASRLPYQYYERHAKKILVLSLIGMLLVFSPIGYSVRSVTGSEFSRWLRIGGAQFQPVEVAKLGLIIYICQFLQQKRNRIHTFVRGMLPGLLILTIAFLMLFKQPDFGSAVLLCGVVLVLLFVGGARVWPIVFLGVFALGLFYVAILLDPYKLQRFQDYIQSLRSPYSGSYQVSLSLNSLALGGVLGSGVGDSIYKLFYLPYPHTDFIFAIIGEELGFLGCLVVILLFMLLIWRGIYIARRVKDRFAGLLAIGITTLIGLQALVNIGVVAGILPTKGITLPFISYGGSSLLASMVCIGILLNISRKVNMKIEIRHISPLS